MAAEDMESSGDTIAVMPCMDMTLFFPDMHEHDSWLGYVIWLDVRCTYLFSFFFKITSRSIFSVSTSVQHVHLVSRVALHPYMVPYTKEIGPLIVFQVVARSKSSLSCHTSCRTKVWMDEQGGFVRVDEEKKTNV